MKKVILFLSIFFFISCGPSAKEGTKGEPEAVTESSKLVDYELSDEEIAAGYTLVTEAESAAYNKYCTEACSGDSECIPGGKRCTCKKQDGSCKIVACRTDSSCPG